jgi:Asp-tRNA(Asn)/Glu-tRNA(Gln) amidotransferase A subunit family amidase
LNLTPSDTLLVAWTISSFSLMFSPFLAEDTPRESALKETKVGIVKSPFWLCAGPGTVGALEKAADILRNHGVQVEDIDFPVGFTDADTLNRMFEVIFVSNGGVAFYNDYLKDTTKTRMDPAVRAFVDDAPKLPGPEVRRAFDYYAAIRLVLDRMAVEYSALLTPSAIDEAPVGLGDMGSPVFNSVWTVSDTGSSV